MNSMKNSLLNNPTLLKALLILGVLIALALIAVAVVLLVRPRKDSEDKQQPDGEQNDEVKPWFSPSRAGMLASFRQARKQLRQKLGSGSLYQVPWYLIVGEAGSGKSAIANTLAGAVSESIENDGETPNWLLLDRAVLIDLPGAVFLPAGDIEGKHADAGDAAKTPPDKAPLTATGEFSRHAWQTFLRLAARFRPRQPLNGIVLTVPAAELLAAASKPGLRDHPRRLVAVARRLADIQRLTGLRLPVYVLVTKCDALPGFGSFARTVFESSATSNVEFSNELFGWSNPYSLESDYSPAWVGEAFDETREVLLQRQLEMMAAATSAEAAHDVLHFPFEIERLHDPLQALLDVVFRITTSQ